MKLPDRVWLDLSSERQDRFTGDAVTTYVASNVADDGPEYISREALEKAAGSFIGDSALVHLDVILKRLAEGQQ